MPGRFAARPFKSRDMVVLFLVVTSLLIVLGLVGPHLGRLISMVICVCFRILIAYPISQVDLLVTWVQTDVMMESSVSDALLKGGRILDIVQGSIVRVAPLLLLGGGISVCRALRLIAKRRDLGAEHR